MELSRKCLSRKCLGSVWEVSAKCLGSAHQLAPIRVASERAAIAQKKESTYLTSRGATPTVLDDAHLRAGPGTPCWKTPRQHRGGETVSCREHSEHRAKCEGLQSESERGGRRSTTGGS